MEYKDKEIHLVYICKINDLSKVRILKKCNKSYIIYSHVSNMSTPYTL